MWVVNAVMSDKDKMWVISVRKIQEMQKQSSGLPVVQSANQENTENKLLTPTLILPPQGGGSVR
ncbi:hypothetical protein ES705_31357 [subsurface metagenome]